MWVFRYVTYDLCLNIENVKQIAKKENKYPDLQFGLFDIVIAFDLKLKKNISIFYKFRSFKTLKKIALLTIQGEKKFYLDINYHIYQKYKNFGSLKWFQEMPKKEYKRKINIIKKYIKQGDIFQANFTHSFLVKKY